MNLNTTDISSYKLTLISYELQTYSNSTKFYVDLIHHMDQINKSIEKVTALRGAFSPKDSFYQLQTLSSRKIIKGNLKFERKLRIELASLKRDVLHLEELKKQLNNNFN